MVPGQNRRASIEILFILANLLRIFQMHQIAQHRSRILHTVIGKRIALPLRQSIIFLYPYSKHIPKLTRISSLKHKVMLVHNPGKIRRDKCSSPVYILIHLICVSSLRHIEQRRNHHLIRRQIIFHTDNIHRHILLKSSRIIILNRIQIFHKNTRPSRILHCPPVIPVKHDCSLRRRPSF